MDARLSLRFAVAALAAAAMTLAVALALQAAQSAFAGENTTTALSVFVALPLESALTAAG